jgi:hypothetical protein
MGTSIPVRGDTRGWDGYISCVDDTPAPDDVWLAELLKAVGPEGAHEIAEALDIDLDEE